MQAGYRKLDYDELTEMEFDDLVPMSGQEVRRIGKMLEWGAVYLVGEDVEQRSSMLGSHMSYIGINLWDRWVWDKKDLPDSGIYMVEFCMGTYRDQNKTVGTAIIKPRGPRLRVHRLEDDWYLATVMFEYYRGGGNNGERAYYLSYMCDQVTGLLELVSEKVSSMSKRK